MNEGVSQANLATQNRLLRTLRNKKYSGKKNVKLLMCYLICEI